MSGRAKKTKKKRADLMFMGVEIDFKKRIPVCLIVRDWEAYGFDWDNTDDKIINCFGMIFKVGKEYQFVARLRYPSLNKHRFSGGGYKTQKETEKDFYKGLDMVEEKMPMKQVHNWKVDLPPNTRDSEGFMAVLKASDQFNIYKNVKEEDIEEVLKGGDK